MNQIILIGITIEVFKNAMRLEYILIWKFEILAKY
jgi:hypothetical protein